MSEIDPDVRRRGESYSPSSFGVSGIATAFAQVSVAPNYCPGIDDDCGDELDAGKLLCPSCQRLDDRNYEQQFRDADGQEELVSFPSLTDDEEHLR